MPNTREKLIDLLDDIEGVCPKDGSCYNCEYDDLEHCCVQAKADHLIANGVTIPVRCKECKHYFHYGDGVYGCRTFGMMKTKPDGFCSYGERRNDE